MLKHFLYQHFTSLSFQDFKIFMLIILKIYKIAFLHIKNINDLLYNITVSKKNIIHEGEAD
jgi:hypothetical protein